MKKLGDISCVIQPEELYSNSFVDAIAVSISDKISLHVRCSEKHLTC